MKSHSIFRLSARRGLERAVFGAAMIAAALLNADPAYADARQGFAYTVGGFLLGCVFLVGVGGAMHFFVALAKRGPRVLLGHDNVTVNPFENMVLYRNGVFERVLLPGSHWINPTRVRLVPVDMRPDVFQIEQTAVTADRIAVHLRCIAKVQVKEARTAIESARDYRAEVFASLQSLIKGVALEWPLKDLFARQETINEAAKDRASRLCASTGIECISFELLDVRPSTELPDLDKRGVGFTAH